ncbi:golgin subfamily a member 7 erf4 protein [Stemphylium lycopersici]|nr:golgin subfamily a member 7 erf4 protein [Stemphylium lycopersici]
MAWMAGCRVEKDRAECTREHGPHRLGAPKEIITTLNIHDTVTTTTSRTPSAAHSPAPETPVPARWSLTNRIFSLNLRSLYQGPPRLPASRLWNPVNSSPRTLQIQNPRAAAVAPPPLSPPRDEHYPNLPIERDAGAREEGRDEYPLLTLPQQRLSRQSPVPSSLAVERSTGEDSISGRTSIGLPRDRRSLPPTQPPTPGPAMASHHDPRDSASAVDKDAEAGHVQPQAPGLSRVSLPGSRRTSIGSRPSASAAADDDGDGASEFPWGPSHPCFPHPNPHVPLDSELYHTTRIIRIKRDWMMKGDLAPTFANLYPEILDPLVTEDDFRILIKKINDTLVDAFDPFTFRAALDTVMGVATFWLWEDAGFTGVKKQLAELERWIEDWNRDIGAKEAVKIIPLRRTGYLTPREKKKKKKKKADTKQHDQLASF